MTAVLDSVVTEPDSSRLHRLRHHNTTVWVTMLLASVASLVASFVLSIDALALAKDPHADLGCNIKFQIEIRIGKTNTFMIEIDIVISAGANGVGI